MRPNDHPPEWPPRRPRDPPHYSGRDARGGEVILRSRTQRWIFFGGLAAFVLFVIAIGIFGIL